MYTKVAVTNEIEKKVDNTRIFHKKNTVYCVIYFFQT